MLTTLTLGWSLAILTLISFDRARALSNPLAYRTEATTKGMLVTSMSKVEPQKIFVIDLSFHDSFKDNNQIMYH